MPTPTEKRALLFLGAVFLLGAFTRAVGASADRAPVPDAAAQVALHEQIARVDSARRAAPSHGRGRRRRASQDSGPRPSRATGGSQWDPDTAPEPVYFLRPSHQRIQRLGADSSEPVDPSASLRDGVVPAAPIDMDIAPARVIERLPRIGPALAQRIVADREARGAFGSLDALMRVRGIGPGIARIIAPLVTFTGTPRPFTDGGTATGDAGGRARRLRKPSPP